MRHACVDKCTTRFNNCMGVQYTVTRLVVIAKIISLIVMDIVQSLLSIRFP